jgi:hypothetical protein
MRALVLVAALAGCGEDTGGGAYVPIGMYNSAYKDAYCTHLVTCGVFTDHDSCMATSLTGPVFEITDDLVAAVLAGKVYYDGGRFASCVAAVAATTCDTTDADGRTPLTACANLFRGALAGGAACAFDGECISQTCARTCGELTCCLGTCSGDTPPVPMTPKPIGQSCTPGGCVASAYCEPSTQICTALKATDATCASSSECAFGLGCVPGSPTVCAPLPKLGQGCSLAAALCRDEGQYCDLTATCVPLGLPGDRCDPSSGRPEGGCSTYYRCDSTTMTCVRLPAVGESCAVVFACAGSAEAYCDTITNMCTASHAAGAMCRGQQGECAVGLFCDATQHCSAPPICD